MNKYVNPAGLIAKPVYNPSKYTAWGNQGQTAFSQGWYPETSYNGQTVYRSNYSPAFSDVVIPNSNEKGHIALIGNNNQKFDVVIRNKQGDIVNTIFKSISPDDVQKYITSKNSVVASRNNSILNGTNQEGRLVSSLLAKQ